MRYVKRMLQRGATAAIMALAILAPVLALAQTEDNAPPQPILKHNPPVWLGYLAMFVMVLVVLVISLMPSKRGHQD